jgi:hypothetical protein
LIADAYLNKTVAMSDASIFAVGHVASNNLASLQQAGRVCIQNLVPLLLKEA